VRNKEFAERLKRTVGDASQALKAKPDTVRDVLTQVLRYKVLLKERALHGPGIVRCVEHAIHEIENPLIEEHW
jgi:hypothetical protein